MTIEWRYTVEQDLGILSVTGYLGPDAVHRFAGAVGWVVGRGSGPVIVDLTGLRGWSTEGQVSITEAARRLAEAGRGLELAAIPADGSLVPDGDCPPIPVHPDLADALAAHSIRHGEPPQGRHEWRTTGWQTGDDTGE
ncbi:anti-sigma factor antagonist [Streptomyces brasiliscabiei]|uniref:Anti-sigma factor antagonist n=1 Tax=Streptomyces brasiliscabiei TaxID=2736302 RepID=A0ABU8GLT2_9ACTN